MPSPPSHPCRPHAFGQPVTPALARVPRPRVAAFRTAPRVAALSTALLLAACGGSDGPGGDDVTRDTLPDGTPRTLHASLPPAEAVAPLVPDLVIGRLEGEGPEVFGDVRGIEAGPDGEIFVLDVQALEVRVFGPEGDYRRTISRRGDGPGEIAATNGLVRVADTLFVYDHAKFVILGLHVDDGRELVRHPTPVRSWGYTWTGTRDDQGRNWKHHSVSDRIPGVMPEPGLQETLVQDVMVMHDPATGAVDSVAVGDQVSRAWVQVFGNQGVSFRLLPFASRKSIAVDPTGGFWVTDGSDYRILRLDAQGDTIGVLEAAVPPRPVTAAEREEFRDRLAAESPDAARAAAEMIDHAPSTHPVVRNLFVAADRLWVVRARAPADEGTRIDVFDRDGGYRGSMLLPADASEFFNPRIRGQSAYLILRDELDVSRVARAPLPGGLIDG